MFCSGCGRTVPEGLAACAQCGRPVPPVIPSAGFSFDIAGYAGKIRTLSILWFVYGGITLVFGFAGLTFAKAFFNGSFGGGFGPWANHGAPPAFIGPMILHFAWISIWFRTALCAVAGWGLTERAPWGRIVAIIAAILSLFHFPLGTALGVATLILLLGQQHWVLYDEL
jgi:hypothetical protein